ncbi:hypothetical protein V8C26DRAFT_272858 [Trichoderma gracile]
MCPVSPARAMSNNSNHLSPISAISSSAWPPRQESPLCLYYQWRGLRYALRSITDAQVSLSNNWLLVGPINPLPSLAPGQSKAKAPVFSANLSCQGLLAQACRQMLSCTVYCTRYRLVSFSPSRQRDKASRLRKSNLAAIRIPPQANGHRHTFVQILDTVMLGSVAFLEGHCPLWKVRTAATEGLPSSQRGVSAGSAGGAAFRPLVGQPGCWRRGFSFSGGARADKSIRERP